MTTFPFALNPAIDRAPLAQTFAENGRVRITDVLSEDSARGLMTMVEQDTPWGMAWQAGAEGPHYTTAQMINANPQQAMASIQSNAYQAMQRGDYGFQYASYPMLQAYMQQWQPGSVQDYVLEHINDAPLLNLVREVTGMAELIKADAQATFYAPGHFLAQHDDSHVGQGWRVAYVLGLCPIEWQPDWGGYLNFFDDAGDIVAGWRPRFNTLSLFRVPQQHHVSFVPPFAPVGRFAITGWFRDR